MKSLFIYFQYMVPQHLLSHLAGKLADANSPWLKNFMIRHFIRHYGVNMEEAFHADAGDYRSFNDFFTRALKPGSRIIHDLPGSIVSPADGTISAAGLIAAGRLLQAKGKSFSLTALLGGKESTADPFQEGSFVTVYLSPKDYHRVHMPCAGTLQKMLYFPGKLFSVNQTTSENIDNLFARNERLVCLFETEAGPMAMILIGAMIVAGIETIWAGQVNASGKSVNETDYSNQQPAIQIAKGKEMGRFNLGSTVIMLFGPGAVSWDELAENSTLRLGESLGTLTASQ